MKSELKTLLAAAVMTTMASGALAGNLTPTDLFDAVGAAEDFTPNLQG